MTIQDFSGSFVGPPSQLTAGSTFDVSVSNDGPGMNVNLSVELASAEHGRFNISRIVGRYVEGSGTFEIIVSSSELSGVPDGVYTMQLVVEATDGSGSILVASEDVIVGTISGGGGSDDVGTRETAESTDPDERYDPADLTITDVEIGVSGDPDANPDWGADPQEGDWINVRVTVNDGGSAGTDFVATVAIVESPDLSSEPIWACTSISTGSTTTYSTEDTHNGSGPFQLSSRGVTLNVLAGDLAEGTNCVDQRDVMSITDRRTVDVVPVSDDGVDGGGGDDDGVDGGDGGTGDGEFGGQVSISNCGFSPSSILPGGDVALEADITNNNSAAASVTVVWTIGQTQVSQTATVPGGAMQTISRTHEPDLGSGSYLVEATISASQA